MIHVLYGPDSFSIQEELARLKAELDADGTLATNTSRLDGAQLQPQELAVVCNTLPFLGAHRLVLVEGLLARFARLAGRRRGRRSRPGDGSPGEEGPISLGPWRQLPDIVAQMPPSTVLVFIDGDIQAKNPLLEMLSPLGSVRPFPLQRKRRDIEAWILARARQNGVNLTREAVQRLMDLVGPDRWTLASEIDKLGTYAGGQVVQREEVEALVPAAREANVFTMVDAVVEGRLQLACQLLEKALQDGQTPAHIFALIVRHYRNLLLAKEMVAAGLNAQQVGGRLNIFYEFALNKLLDQASRASVSQLEASYRRLLEADASIKRGIYSEELALELLVTDLVGTGAPAGSSMRSHYHSGLSPSPII